MGRSQTEDRGADLSRRVWRLVSAMEDVALLVLDEAGQVVAVSAGAEQLTGYSEGALRSRHHSCLYPADAVADESPERDLRAAEGSGQVHLRGDRRRSDGSVFDARIIVSALRDDGGRLLGFGVRLNDARTPPQNPTSAREGAIPAPTEPSIDPAVGRKIHDFNNLLTVILGNAEALAQRLDGQPELLARCETIADAAVRGAEFTRALFDAKGSI